MAHQGAGSMRRSYDAVRQGRGRPEEDDRGRSERGGWARFDNEASTVMDEIHQRADAFVFGRRGLDKWVQDLPQL